MSEFENEFTKYKNMITRAYVEYSIINAATHNRVFNQTTDMDLHFSVFQIRETVPIEWFSNSTICPEPFFYDLGRNITIGEENHLIGTILDTNTTSVSISQVSLSQIQQVAHELISERCNELVLFIPADLATPLYVETPGVEFDNNLEFLRVDHANRVQLFLTSKYVRLNDLLLVDKSFGEWVFKQGDYSKTLTVQIAQTELNNVKVLVKTQVAYNILRPEAVRIIKLTANN